MIIPTLEQLTKEIESCSFNRSSDQLAESYKIALKLMTLYKKNSTESNMLKVFSEQLLKAIRAQNKKQTIKEETDE